MDILQVRELAQVYGLDFVVFAARMEERIQIQPYRPPRRQRSDARVSEL